MKLKTIFTLFVFTWALNSFAHGDKDKDHKSTVATSYIVSPKHGETVDKTFVVVFGLKGMGVSPAGMEKANTGHHHLMIDRKELPDVTKPLDKTVKHFGGGQTETTLTLSPGTHTLQLILADHKHLPHSPAVISKKIKIIVK